jgi:predicted outer membrane repeat protein
MFLCLAACSGSLIACDGDTTTATDTGTTLPTDDTGTTVTDDTGTTGTTGACDTPVVMFTTTDGAVNDLTSFFETGEYLTLGLDGTLTVCPGTWYARVLVRADVTVVGLGATPADTILSGGESGTILDVLGPDQTLDVSNVTLDRGAGLDVDHNSGGGGIYCEQQGVVIVRDAVFSNNFANDGSGLYTQYCTVDLENVTFKDNLSEDDGGAITLWFSTATLNEVTIENNQALDGGAMAMFSSDATITNSWIEGNTSSIFASGIWVNDSTISISDTTITGNINTGSDHGGGLLVHGDATLKNVQFTQNEAPLGGGLYVFYGATIDGSACGFIGNSPDDIYVDDGSAGQGESIMAGGNYSFTCANNACVEK